MQDTQLYEQIKADGIDHASKRFSQILIRDFLTNESLAYEFVLQELDGARNGTEYAKQFVKDSGIPPSEYHGHLSNDTPELDKAQLFFVAISMKLQSIDLDFSVELRVNVVNKIMQYYNLGRYDKKYSNDDIIITSPHTSNVELQSETGVNDYNKKLSNLSFKELCIEFSNVMAAKHNLVFVSNYSINTYYEERQEIITDLTNKAFCICMFKFGQDRIVRYTGKDVKRIHQLINEMDEEVARCDRPPYQHGLALFKKLEHYLG